MRYTSTRDASKFYTFEEALCSGYAPDGGLYVPESLPQVDANKLKHWATLSYVDLATEVMGLFISPEEVSTQDLASLCQKSLQGFPVASVVPVVKVGNVYVAELFHGPTFCFKDLGMQAVIHWLGHFATARNIKVTLVVSTTGDTGPAAVRAIRDVDNPLMSILVHYPEGQISEFQRKQLTTIQYQSPQNIKVAAFQGGGDDMDLPIKRIAASNDVSETNRIVCGVNSYNIGRPLMQMVHYVSSLQLLVAGREKLSNQSKRSND
jgi:threonine synthase